MLRKDISKYSYGPKVLRRLIRKDDFWRYDLKKDEIEELTKQIALDFSNGKSEVKSLSKHSVRGRDIFTMDTLYDALTIRCTGFILKNTFPYTLFSRDREITQIWEILKTEKRGWIFRTDIKSFFENIPFKKLNNDLFLRGMNNRISMNHLENICAFVGRMGCDGIPRGLPISSTLAEIALSQFDKEIRGMKEVVYYTRYVDDIFIVFEKENINFQSIIADLLPYNLNLNPAKTRSRQLGTNTRVDFLGYTFLLNNLNDIEISRRKIAKIKSRIILSIRSFLYKDRDFTLLYDRLKFLTGNTSLSIAGREKPIYVGFRYNYHLCHEETIRFQLKELDTFLKSILFSKKYSLSQQLRTRLKAYQFELLEKLSFWAGYKNCIIHRQGRNRISRIKDAWRYE